MSKYQYKNISSDDLVLIGYGVVAANKTLETDDIIDNPNLELVTDTKAKDKPVNKDDTDVK